MLVSQKKTQKVINKPHNPQIWYKTGRLRIVISTANLIDIDWRDIENVRTPLLTEQNLSKTFSLKTAWVQDIPRRSSAIPHDPKITDDFPSIMQYVLQKTYVRPALRAIRLDVSLYTSPKKNFQF